MRAKRLIRGLFALLVTTSLTAVSGSLDHSGTVLETMDSGGYTYAKVEENGATLWAAAPAAKLAVGDQVRFTEQMRMKNFTSPTLNRTFDEILFVGGFGGSSTGASAGPEPAVEVVDPVAKAEDGYTIEEVFSRKEDLKGKRVKVRGKVVKVSENIMGHNWIHLQDGTGAEGTNRLIFRSEGERATVGSVVTAQGILDTDKDFGFGYQYPVLIEDSTFSE